MSETDVVAAVAAADALAACAAWLGVPALVAVVPAAGVVADDALAGRAAAADLVVVGLVVVGLGEAGGPLVAGVALAEVAANGAAGGAVVALAAVVVGAAVESEELLESVGSVPAASVATDGVPAAGSVAAAAVTGATAGASVVAAVGTAEPAAGVCAGTATGMASVALAARDAESSSLSSCDLLATGVGVTTGCVAEPWSSAAADAGVVVDCAVGGCGAGAAFASQVGLSLLLVPADCC